ncbi:hypothetical protein AGMMS49928_17490 [Spirochaetia bacterium]|nr:hypothetical protein AGMMS49928_17490 [Spirochaetia bacterium]
MKKLLSRRYYRLGLAAAQQHCLSEALQYAHYAVIMDSDNSDAVHLAEICRSELAVPADVLNFVRQKKWLQAARLFSKVPALNVHSLSIQGCLWALAKRSAKAADCFTRVTEKDCRNYLALQVLTELKNRRHNLFGRFF